MEIIEKISDTELKVTTSNEAIVTVEELQQKRAAAQEVVERIAKRRELAAKDLDKEEQAAHEIIEDCNTKLTNF